MQANASQPQSVTAEVGFKKSFFKNLLFYSASVLGIHLLEKWEPSGPCSIGLGMFAFIFVFIPTSAGLVLYNLHRARKNRLYAWIALLHVVGLFCVFRYF